MSLEKFDYIIVGAGSAGCVLANRLTRNGKHTVLLLEAGGSDRKFWIQTPIGYGKTFFDNKVNWCYQTETNPTLNNRKSYWPRGKVIGGSSSINAMVYVRGSRHNYEDWKNMGNDGWGWDDVLPYFIKSETNANGGSDYRGEHGPLYVNDVSKQYHPLTQTFIEAATEYGIPFNADFNGSNQEGVGNYQINTKHGLRMSAARAYLYLTQKRNNCTVRTHCHTTRILFENNKAIGVEYIKNNKIYRAYCQLEVIVSAGAVNSPQLLQLSGIGPATLLEQFAIPVIQNAPAVGKNLQDHLAYTHYYRSKVPTLNNQLSPWWGKITAGIQYLLTRKGPLSLSVNQAGGFIRSQPQQSHPNLQIYFAAITYNTAPAGERPLMQPDPFAAFLNSISQCRPSSRGQIHIQSTDPLQHPKIEPNYLSTEKDCQEMLAGAKFLRAIAQMPALKKIIDYEMTPGEHIHSDEALLDDIKNRSDTVYHPTSTCIMGNNAANSVVDNTLKVHGIAGLRVVDASIFPTIITGNTNAATIMVAEKAADMIIDEAG